MHGRPESWIIGVICGLHFCLVNLIYMFSKISIALALVAPRLRGHARSTAVVIQPDGKILVGGYVVVDTGLSDGLRRAFLV